MGFLPLCGEKRDELMTYYDAGQYDIAVIGAGHMGPHRRWGALCAYKRFGLQAKTLADCRRSGVSERNRPQGGS